jgi:hypothetical protein
VPIWADAGRHDRGSAARAHATITDVAAIGIRISARRPPGIEARAAGRAQSSAGLTRIADAVRLGWRPRTGVARRAGCCRPTFLGHEASPGCRTAICNAPRASAASFRSARSTAGCLETRIRPLSTDATNASRTLPLDVRAAHGTTAC